MPNLDPRNVNNLTTLIFESSCCGCIQSQYDILMREAITSTSKDCPGTELQIGLRVYGHQSPITELFKIVTTLNLKSLLLVTISIKLKRELGQFTQKVRHLLRDL